MCLRNLAMSMPALRRERLPSSHAGPLLGRRNLNDRTEARKATTGADTHNARTETRENRRTDA
jgi:hypothetical protein